MAAQPMDYLPRHRLTVEDYRMMIREGIIRPDLRTEHMDGVVYDRAPQGRAHAETVRRMADRARSAVGQAAFVVVQRHVELGHICEVHPDVTLLRPRDDNYESTPPDVKSVLLLIDVSETNSKEVRRVKGPLYARYGIPEVWFVALEDHLLFVFQEPGADKYRETRALDRATMLAPRLLPECAVDLSGLH